MKNLTAHHIIAAVALAVSFIVYTSTVADTVSFWDCGEFIAASYSMGVPHPPGAPFYLMLGRFFSLLPLASDIGLRVNMMSPIVSALTVLFLYLSIVRLIRAYHGREQTTAHKITVYGAGLVGALAFAFSTSFWFNAVEAEVYAMSMFFTAIVFYLALRWLDVADQPQGNAILLFIFYLFGLSSGVHLLNVLTIPALTYIVAFYKYPVNVKTFLIAGLIGCVLTLAIYPGIIQGFPFLILKLSIWGVIVLLGLMLWAAYWCYKNDKRILAMSLIVVLLVMLGYTTFFYIKIRSGLNPFLDENDPETWASLLAYINREQYGSESLFLGMFKRNAPFWSYQIRDMYFRYLGWNFFEPARLFAIPLLLGLIGMFHHFYRDKKNALVILALFFMTGLAIVLYVNQDDPQPRERDYSYVGSFYAFAVWIGLGALALIETAQTYLRQIKREWVTGGTVGILLLAAPVNMLVQNYDQQDRRGNYVAWDYSYNLLNTCEPNAIIYTNGDNDTFPLWYLQVVDNVRPDVRVVNLSLLNTGWFVRQIRDKEPKCPMTAKITDNYIKNVIDSREVEGLRDRIWAQTRKVQVQGLTPSSPKLVWDVPGPLAYPVGAGGRYEYFLRVQDLMILNTIAQNASDGWAKPIYFAVTVSDNNLCGLRNLREPNKNYLAMEGLAFRLHPEPVGLIDPRRVAENMMRVYKYRSIKDRSVYFDDNVLRLLGNYRQGLIQLAYHWIQQAEYADDYDSTGVDMPLKDRVEQFEVLPLRIKALTALEFMDSAIPDDRVPIKYDFLALEIGRRYAQLGRPDQMRRILDRIVKEDTLTAQKALEYGTYYLTEAQSPDRARELFELSLSESQTLENIYRIGYMWLQFGGDTAWLKGLYDSYLAKDDSRMTRLKVAGHTMNLGMLDVALGIYEPLWRADPGDGAAVQGLVECHKRRGDLNQALTYVNDWLGAYPDDSNMVRKRAELLALQGR